jgi:hypothetical protein
MVTALLPNSRTEAVDWQAELQRTHIRSSSHPASGVAAWDVSAMQLFLGHLENRWLWPNSDRTSCDECSDANSETVLRHGH